MSIGPMGISGGMDINAMVNKIVDAERVPKQQRIDNERMTIDASISAYGRLRESLDTMKGLMTNFRQAEAFAARTVNTTDDSIVSATATTKAIAGKYAIDVLQLAQSHKVASETFSEDTKFGPGKLQVSFGNKSFDVDVRSNSKLVDIVRGINGTSANSGVRASVINDTEGPRLILASNLPGEKHQLKVLVESATGNPLKKLEYQTLQDRTNAINAAREAVEAVVGPLAMPESTLPQSQQVDANGNFIPPDVQQSAGDDQRQSQVDVGVITSAATDVLGLSDPTLSFLKASYAVIKEAQQLFQDEKVNLEQKIAPERAAYEQQVQRGILTEEEAQQRALDELEPTERSRLEKMYLAEEQFEQLQPLFETEASMIQVQAGQDAVVILDGVAKLSSSNNVIEDAIEGVDLTLKGQSQPGKPPAEIGVEYDRQSVRSDIENFVSAYNTFYQTSKALSSVDPVTGQKGPLAGDSTVRNADSRLKAIFSSGIEDAPVGLQSLTEFGITTTRQGNLEVNYDLLDRQLNNNFNDLGDFFGGNTGFARQIEDAIHGFTGVTGSIRTRERSLSEQNYRLTDDQAALDRRMESLEQRTHNKFAAMQDATGKMQGQLGALMSAMGQ
ncbi:flagellar filament capping protein FliD [Vibrio azureus]|uniref:Flagellar hook-associated protein 2 n=1 Tax=Vibrio azureus NBRC 104587 TaxID=1219077 RepID=U3A528_9VIBR|nr:flagellar filament capping protein FliD [Vibrio azureus]AUI86687.1 flagellar filament capping protein FliD [Vibrio azureus]GAD75121.1 flagellar hook-associated protein 2 [Vibrio azureus NBRC 104587]